MDFKGCIPPHDNFSSHGTSDKSDYCQAMHKPLFSDSRFDWILNANKGLQNSAVPPVDNLGSLVLPSIQVQLLCSHMHLNEPNMEVKHSRF